MTDISFPVLSEHVISEKEWLQLAEEDDSNPVIESTLFAYTVSRHSLAQLRFSDYSLENQSRAGQL